MINLCYIILVCDHVIQRMLSLCVSAIAIEISGGFRGGSEVSMEPPFLAKSKIDRYTKATVVG